MKIKQHTSTANAVRKPVRRTPGPKAIGAALGAFWLLAIAAAGTVAAQDPSSTDAGPSMAASSPGCAEIGMNMQCTAFGTIKMDARRDIRGSPIDVAAQIQLNTSHSDRGARWIMFSVRNVTDEGPSPVTIAVIRMSTASGDVVTTRVEQTKAAEVNLWVDVLDLPLGVPISLELNVGATQRGAFALETLVMAFDRGYAPIKDGFGNDASLFSFTLLGVNQESRSTAGDEGDSIVDGKKLPAPGLVAGIVVLGVLAAVGQRRRSP